MKFKEVQLNKLSSSLSSNYHKLWDDFLNFKESKIFILVFSIGFILRLIHISQPIKGDEAATFLSYVEPINPLRVFVYTYPNNHIFHTFLVKISTLFFGNNLIAIRLPAFLASLGIIYLTYAICKKFEQNGIFAAINASIWPYLIAYATNSRGYSLICFLSLFLVYIYLNVRSDLNSSNIIILSFISSLGLFTMPTFLILIMATYSWISIDMRFNFKKEIKFYRTNILLIFFTALFTIFLYLPVFLFSPNGFMAVLSNKSFNSLTLNTFLNSFGNSLVSTINSLSQSLPSIYIFILFILFIFGIFSYLSDFKILKFTLFPIIFITSIFVISVKLVLPPARVWVFFIPFFLIVVDNGFSKIIDNLKNKKKLFLFLLIIIYSLSITQTFSNKALINIEEISFADAEIAVKYLESQRIIMNKQTIGAQYYGFSMPLNYYNWKNDAKIHFNKNRIYRKKGFYESLKEDYERFTKSKWQVTRDVNIDFIIVNKNYIYETPYKDYIPYKELVNKYPLKIRLGSLEIYSAK